MPGLQHSRPSSPPSSNVLRIGAGFTVLTAHMAVVGALYWMPEQTPPPPLLKPHAVMVSVIEAPVPQIAKTEISVKPQPESLPESLPEPVMPPPEPGPALKPNLKLKPQPKVEKPVEKPKPPTPKPAPVPTRSETPPADAPEGVKVTQPPVQGPPPDQSIIVSSVEYAGRRPMPEYPKMSQRLREEGRVVVLVQINTIGVVDKATIDTSSGFSHLDRSALAAARKARFKPLMRNGVAYPAKAKLPFDFVMRNY